jgi:outer membrane murein-binding lipoprotein Lpp
METKKKFETKGILIAFIVLITVVAAVVLIQSKSKIDDLSSQNTNLNMTLEERDSLVNEMASTFDEIEQNLTFIREKRAQLELAPQEGVANQKELLIADIALMNEMLVESSKKIEELEKKLNASGIEIKSFNNKIAQLNKNITEQNNNIALLQSEIENRDFQIAEMDMKIKQMDNNITVLNEDLSVKTDSIHNAVKLIEKQDTELNKVFFASGSFEELQQNGVLIKEGGFLGIGKKQTIRDDLNQNYFTELDKRNANFFPVFSKKAKIVTEHPAESYSFVYDDDQITYLEIENPEEFWKLTSYAIIEIKR